MRWKPSHLALLLTLGWYSCCRETQMIENDEDPEAIFREDRLLQKNSYGDTGMLFMDNGMIMMFGNPVRYDSLLLR